MVFSRQDCSTGQSPGCRGSLGAVWDAAGSAGVEGCFSEHLAEEGLVSFHVGMVGAIYITFGRRSLSRTKKIAQNERDKCVPPRPPLINACLRRNFPLATATETNITLASHTCQFILGPFANETN